MAMPFAEHGSKCSSVSVDVTRIRAMTGGGTDTSTALIAGTSSIDCTRCVSGIPGFAKQTLTPVPTNNLTRLSAQYTVQSCLPAGFVSIRD